MSNTIKPLRDTFIFSELNKDGYIDKKVAAFTSPNTGVRVTPDMIEDELVHINKTFKYPNKMAVLEAVKNGTIIPVMLQPSVHDRMPVCIPFLVSKDRTKVVVFIDSYVKRDRDGVISIDYKKLYCLLESGYIAMEGIKRNSTKVISKGSMIFAHLMTRVFNKKFSLNTDRSAMNKIIFLCGEFFLYNHIGMTDHNMIFNYALKNCNSATAILMRDVDAEFGPECFTSLAVFLKKLSTSSYKFVAGFETITTRDFIETFANMYGQSTILGLESLEYFMFIISSVTIGAYLNNQVILEDIIDKDGAQLYLELGR